MKAKVYSLDGKVKSEIELPVVFSAPYRERIINRAFLASFTSSLQAKSNYERAGRQTTAEYVGKRRVRDSLIAIGHARKPRTKNARHLIQGWVAGIPGVKGGPKAHPPKVEKIIKENINKKERRLALKSAIAATANKSLVAERGHILPDVEIPFVLSDDFESLNKTKDFFEAIKKLGLHKDVERAKLGKKVRAGKGKMRGRYYKRKKSFLLVVSSKDSSLIKAARNLEGVDVVDAASLSILDLAPGGKAGRLTLFTESALKKIVSN